MVGKSETEIQIFQARLDKVQAQLDLIKIRVGLAPESVQLEAEKELQILNTQRDQLLQAWGDSGHSQSPQAKALLEQDLERGWRRLDDRVGKALIKYERKRLNAAAKPRIINNN